MSERSGKSGKTGGGLRGLVDAVRSAPERLKRPEALILVMAMLASLGAHMPPWLGLGALADYLAAQEAAEQRRAPVEVSFEFGDPPKEEVAKEPAPIDAPPPPLEPEKKKEPKKEPKKEELAEKPPEPKPEVKVSKVEVVPPPPPPPPPPPQPERRQSVTQKSEDPNVEPPPDAKFLAEESRRVEEETVARVTSTSRDDQELNESAPQSANEPEQSGDARKDEKGLEKGSDKPDEEAVLAQPKPAQPPPAAQETPVARASEARPKVAPKAPAPAPIAPGTVVKDPLGSFVLAEPKRSAPSQAGQRGSAPQAAQPNLRVSWRAFEETFGSEQLAKDRMPPDAKRRGAGREKRWSEFKAAIENYIVGVKPGNQTALNAAADAFAAYLAAFHRNLHIEFAHQFLGGLPMAGELGNPNLMTKVEIVVNPDGTLDRVGIVKSSGQTMYDFGAFNAVQRGAPYPPPPEKIRSPDGRTYLRWALHRNESQCGTWNAEPFILKSPPRSPNDPKEDNVSPYRSPSESGREHGRAPEEPRPVPQKGATRPFETLGLTEARRRNAG